MVFWSNSSCTHNSSLEGARKLCHSVPFDMPFPMVSVFGEVKIFRFKPKKDYSNLVRRFDQILLTLITPHWKEL